MAPTVQELAQMRVTDLLKFQEDIADSISLALDPELMLDSVQIDEVALNSFRKDIDTLTERVNRLKEPLERLGKLVAVREGIVAMLEQLEFLHKAIDPNYEPKFSLAIPPSRQSGQASSSSRSSNVASGSERPSTPNFELPPASGPRRRTPSFQGHRLEPAATPSPPSRQLSRPKLEPSPRRHGVTFDVVFLPFISSQQKRLPDPALREAQHCLKRLGLVFQVTLSRGLASVEDEFNTQVKEFCSDQQVILESGGITDWALMLRKGTKSTLVEEVLTTAEFTVTTLMDKRFALRNYISDGARKVLLIAPLREDLHGAINLPDVESRQLKHYCHVARLDVAIGLRVGPAICSCRCPPISVPNAAAGSSRRLGAGRTLA
ncbi:hypothetical protein C8R43DRAFT_1007705 [Mycena crocata]|nr:hypothetical protein C8R43DRAFT_1007705 [Mycena crocata]